MADDSQALLRAILQTVARQSFPTDRLAEIVSPKSSSQKQLEAYNMCNGERSQSEIVKELALDQGNFSRTVTRWIEAGVLFRLGDGRDARLLHVYPLPDNAGKGKER